MREYSFDYDLPFGVGPGRPVPDDLSEVPMGALRFDGLDVVDVMGLTDWLIDGAGNKRHPSSNHPDAGDWQSLTVALNAGVVKDATTGDWRGETDADRQAADVNLRLDEIKQAVRRRIYAVASVETQMNMSGVAAFISSKTAANRSQAEKDHLSAYEASLGWVGAMRVNVATLAADPNLDFTDDANWPVTPPEVIALAARF